MPGKTVRPLLLPSDDFARRPIPATRQEARTWFRVHWEDRNAIEFALNPGHRFSHRESPRAVLYLAASIQTCLWEVFGDDVLQQGRVIARSRWEGRCLSEINVPEIKVCAVSTERTRSIMGVELGSLLAADLTVPQAWAWPRNSTRRDLTQSSTPAASWRNPAWLCLSARDFPHVCGRSSSGRYAIWMKPWTGSTTSARRWSEGRDPGDRQSKYSHARSKLGPQLIVVAGIKPE